jgi:hypothetical protein
VDEISHLRVISIAVFSEESARPGGQAVFYGAASHAAPAKSDLIRQDATPYTRATHEEATWRVSPVIPKKSLPQSLLIRGLIASLAALAQRGSRRVAAAFLSHSQAKSMTARSFVQDSGARFC